MRALCGGELIESALALVGVQEETNFQRDLKKHFARADRLFAWVMAAQYALALALALVLSPRTWDGTRVSTHPHVWLALLLGGALAAYPVALVFSEPGETRTRYVVAISQGLFTALLIHLTGGRIETHFHVFGSLAFLAIYRDWRVLALNTAVVALDHALRGALYPMTIYGVGTGTEWRFLEHAAWVLFEDAFLFAACAGSMREMRATAHRQAELEIANARAELATREAERVNRVQGELLSRVSHELRTPLNAILGFGELLRLDDLDADQADSVDEIVEAGERLMRLIDGVLDPTIAGLRADAPEEPLSILDAAARSSRQPQESERRAA